MPTIGNLGTMFVRGENKKLVPVPCIQGKNGITPHIGENGNWWIGDTDTGAMADNKKYPVSASVYEKIITGKPSEYTLEILLKDGERIRAELPNMGLTPDDVVEIGIGEPSEFDDINYKQFYLDKNTGRLYINTSKMYPNSYITIGGVVLSGENDPTGGEDAYINNLYVNTTTGAIFLCVRIESFMPSEPPHPVWQQIGGTGVDVGTDITLGITGAAAGQTVKITEVDEDGRPVKWEAADIPAQTAVDSTLSIEGSAADAKAVGDKLTEVSEAIVEQGKTIPKVFQWANAELPFTESEISDTETGAGFVVNPTNYADGKTYFRYHAGATSFKWTNPNPKRGALTITMRGYSQYSSSLSTRIVTVYTDGTDNSLTDIMYLKHGETVTYTTDPDKTVDYILGNYDFEDWVLLDMDVLSIVADYPAPTGTVKSVNGNLPDENGNVQITIPSGGGSGGTDIALGISGAAVGQIARITAVDDAGMPTAWEAVDLPGMWELITEGEVLASDNVVELSTGDIECRKLMFVVRTNYGKNVTATVKVNGKEFTNVWYQFQHNTANQTNGVIVEKISNEFVWYKMRGMTGARSEVFKLDGCYYLTADKLNITFMLSEAFNKDSTYEIYRQV